MDLVDMSPCHEIHTVAAVSNELVAGRNGLSVINCGHYMTVWNLVHSPLI